ncbi:MAG: hypothetical protein BWY42_00955 [Candidatus Omnitrophica bacterium ADurb.Bin277]|jgi:hypothetical protein|nr:MAG: hypothetical protein BWY42_00955 [Candidatus Omnitrophica bacterium ADurb.Bin277]
MRPDSNRKISSAGVQRVFEQRCQAHVAVNGRNPTPEQRAAFKAQVVDLAKRKNVDERRS